MPDPDYDPFDDLDAFFSAAASEDPGAVAEAAENVVSGTKRIPRPAEPNGARLTGAERHPAAPPRPAESEAAPASGAPDEPVEDIRDLYGKFIAIDPDTLPGGAAEAGGRPFVLVPAHIHSFLPWWGWGSIALGLLILLGGVILTPSVNLDRLAAKLDDGNPDTFQPAMRQLVIKSDGRTIGKLYDIASSTNEGMGARLRAVDTLSLIQAAEADRALLRLELSSATSAQVREAAIAARKQREAAKTRSAGR